MAPKRGFQDQPAQPRILNSEHNIISSDLQQSTSTRTAARNTKARRSYNTEPTSPAFTNELSQAWNQNPAESTSRRESSSSMRTSTTPLDTAVTYTPTTHRVSKAKKGKRVHACEYPDCNKIFTRAEHKRRHEASHNPEAVIACNRPGCRKEFNRPDLLQRHLERHDLADSSEEVSGHRRQMSHVSMSSEAPTSMATTMSGPMTPSTGPRQPLSIGSLVHPSNETKYAAGFGTYERFGVPAAYSFMPGFASSEESLYYTPESSLSPSSDHFTRQPHRNSISSPSSVIDYHPNVTSPLVNGIISSDWSSLPNPPSILPSSILENDSNLYPSTKSDISMPLPFSDLDGHEWTVIRRELSSIFGVVATGIFHTVRWQHCLNCYWQNFHPSFPVLHQPTFFTTKPRPLLTAAMVAIGSQYDTRLDAKHYSMALLEISTRLLRGRETITNRSRLTDMQTILLLENLKRFRSRRTEVEVSARFRTLYTGISDMRQWTTTNPLAIFRSLQPNYTEEALTKAHRFWVDLETKRRILHAAFVMDTQQAVFFEQPLTVLRHSPPRLRTQNLGQSVAFPCDSDLWESSPIEKWAENAAKARDIDLATATEYVMSGKTDRLDPFQCQLIISHLITTSGPSTPPEDGISLLSNIVLGDASHPLTFSYFGFLAAEHTPIRALLIVSGESWLLGRKIDHEADFQAAQQRLRAWVDARTDSSIALYHATNLLRSVINISPAKGVEQDELAPFRDTFLLHEQWCIYIAVLICWSYGYTASLSLSAETAAASINSEAISHASSSSSSSRAHPHTHPCLMDPQEADAEMREYLRATTVAQPEDLRKLDSNIIGRTHGLLESVRFRKIVASIPGHYGGLVNEAERVLYRLVEGWTRLLHF